MTPVFAHGDLRLYLLRILDEGPRHGYEVIRLLEDRFVGLYTPSAGTIYPRLAALEDDGLVEHSEEEGRKVYRITEGGRRELARRREDMAALEARVATSARQLARDMRQIREEVRTSVRDLRRDLRETTRDLRRDERRDGRERRERERERDPGRERDRVHDGEWRDELRSVRADLEAFVTDVVAAARRLDLDADRLRRLRRVLLDARAAVMDALSDRQSETGT